MDNIVTLNKDKANTIEFQIAAEGLEAPQEMQVRLCMFTKDFTYLFNCERRGGDTYSVSIPAMPFLEKTLFNCTIEVVAEGYYFKAMQGGINVVGNAQISGQPVAKLRSEEPVTQPYKAPDEQPTPSTTSEPATESEKKKFSFLGNPDKMLEEAVKSVDKKKQNSKDDAVREILKSVNTSPSRKNGTTY